MLYNENQTVIYLQSILQVQDPTICIHLLQQRQLLQLLLVSLKMKMKSVSVIRFIYWFIVLFKVKFSINFILFQQNQHYL